MHPGDVFVVGLYWQTSRSLAAEDEIVVWLRLLDAAGQGIGLEDSYPGSGTLPTSLWPVGSLLAGRQYVRVGEDTDAPLVARLDVELYHGPDGERLTVGSDLPTIGRVKVVPRRWPSVDRNREVARFDAGGKPGSVTLAALVLQDKVEPGQLVPLVLTWIVQAPPERDYTVFVHLEDDAGQVVGYGDGVPRAGNYPIRYWAAKEVIVDERLLAVDVDTPPGRYRLQVGLYDETGRVAAYRVDGGRWTDDAVDLGTVEVK